MNNKKKFLLNEYYFESIDAEMKAYLVGLWQADGNIRPAKRGQDILTIKLQNIDEYLLQYISIELFGIDVTHTYHSPSTIKTYPKSHPSTELTFRSNQFSKNLQKLGITYNKTHSLIITDALMDVLWNNEKLAAHWFRGLFDGDGCISSSNGKQSFEIYNVNCNFLNQISEIILHHINVQCKLSRKHGTVDAVAIYARQDVKTVLHWMYTPHTICMNRKLDKSKSLGLI